MSFVEMSDDDVLEYANKLRQFVQDGKLKEFALQVFGDTIDQIVLYYDRYGQINRVRAFDKYMSELEVEPRAEMLKAFVLSDMTEGYLGGSYHVGEPFRERIEQLFDLLNAGEDAWELEQYIILAMSHLPTKLLGKNRERAGDQQYVKISDLAAKHPGYSLFKNDAQSEHEDNDE